MQISIDTEILENIFTHFTTATRLAGYIDGNIVVDELTKSIDELARTVAELLGKPYVPRPAGEPTQGGVPELTVVNAVDDLCQVVARADALANAAVNLFDQVIWGEGDGDHYRLERLAHLVGATSEAVQVAVEVGGRLAIELSTRRPGA